MNWKFLSIGLLFVLGLTFVAGSLGLLGPSSDESQSLTAILLESVIFDNYLLPGIMVFLTSGVSSIVIAILTIRNKENYPKLILGQGLVLLFWLILQFVVRIDFFQPFLYIPYFVISVLLIFASLRLNRSYPKPVGT